MNWKREHGLHLYLGMAERHDDECAENDISYRGDVPASSGDAIPKQKTPLAKIETVDTRNEAEKILSKYRGAADANE